MKVKELINFEEIQDVIEIGAIKDEKDLVEKYVISPTLQDELLDLLSVLDAQRHKSANIIGNYGTGKSHLLGFLSLVLSKPELIQYIQNDKVKEKLQNLKREFFIVKYELAPTQTLSLAKVFFYRVQKQLKDNYGIDLREIEPEKEVKDVKELVQEVMDLVKKKDPKKGLLVIFDEFSDFLKQKQSHDRNYDLQTYRQLGECSNTLDFMFIASMQEYIFTNPQYVDQAESIARTQQRYKDVRITNESVEEMIAKRVVNKNSNQQMELKKQFSEIAPYFSNLASEENKYVRLYPIHPYVIEVFSKLPFFEKRGIIQFLSEEIKKILTDEFPSFITYDKIYNRIEKVLSIKNHPDVRPICDAVDTLKSKIDLLDAKLRPTAIKLVKALAILNLINASNKNGASAQELANTLFIIPSVKIMKPIDDIERILENLRKVSDGQLISKSDDGIYYLDLQKTQDYDVIINNKVSNMNDLKYVNEKFVENFLLKELDVEYDPEKLAYFDTSKKYVLPDSAYWEDRKSFRQGELIIDIGYDVELSKDNDYTITFLGFGQKDTKINSKNNILIKIDYSDALKESIKKLAAIEEFIRTKTYISVMQSKKRSVIDKELRPELTKALLSAKISYKNKEYKPEEDLGIGTEVTAEIFRQLKQSLLNEEFTQSYPKYPKFKSRLSAENVKGTVESIFRDISSKPGLVENLLNQSVNILLPLGLYKDNRLDVTESEYAKIILDKLEDANKNISIQDLINELAKAPHGLQKEISQLVISILLRNGDIILSSKRGNIYSASDFNTLFNQGLRAFDEISYLKKEEDLNVSKVQILFDALSEDGSLLQTQRDRPEAYRKYMDKIDRIEKDIKEIGEDFERLKQSINIGLPIEELNDKIEDIRKTDFSRLKIKSIVEFKKLDYSPERIKQIQEGYGTILKLKSFFEDYFSYIQSGMNYMKNVLEHSDSDFFKKSETEQLSSIYKDSKDIITNIKKLLKDDERKPLKGKIESYKDKWQKIYYNAHENYVGKKVDWKTLEQVEDSENVQKLKKLQDIRCVNKHRFTENLLKITELKNIKCMDFNVDELKTTAICPHCMFPNVNEESVLNINSKISNLETEFENILQSWESHIFGEIQNNQDKIDNLDHAERRVVQDILSQGYLDKEISDDTITAINNLLQDLEIKEVDFKEMYKTLTQESDVLKIDDFRSKIEDYLEGLLGSKDGDNVRLKIRMGSKNND
jgi:KaiC/GvpD/RAD55 family RecA-like ATPase